MTTRFKEHDLTEGLTGAIHETGHSLYEQVQTRTIITFPLYQTPLPPNTLPPACEGAPNPLSLPILLTPLLPASSSHPFPPPPPPTHPPPPLAPANLPCPCSLPPLSLAPARPRFLPPPSVFPCPLTPLPNPPQRLPVILTVLPSSVLHVLHVPLPAYLLQPLIPHQLDILCFFFALYPSASCRGSP